MLVKVSRVCVSVCFSRGKKEKGREERRRRSGAGKGRRRERMRPRVGLARIFGPSGEAAAAKLRLLTVEEMQGRSEGGEGNASMGDWNAVAEKKKKKREG